MRDRSEWWAVVSDVAGYLEEGSEDPVGEMLECMERHWGKTSWAEFLDQAGFPVEPYAPGTEPRFKGPGNMNIRCDRRARTLTDKFDDRMELRWQDSKGNWRGFDLTVTTDPGFRGIDQPMNANGTAVLCDGFHPGLWKLGQHRGRYTTLVAARPAKVWRVRKGVRYYNDKGKVYQASGINFHRAGVGYDGDESVGKWSMGCVVAPDELEQALACIIVAASTRKYGRTVSVLVE